jgi:nicotinamidase-related amidase
MTTLPGRENTALLVIDMQNGVVDIGYNRDSVIANIGALVERARGAGVPVIWVQHTDEDMPVGSEAWEYVSELTRGDSEPLVQKEYGDAFEDTELEELLSAAGVGQLIVTGAQTDQCVRSTLHGAVTRGYDATLVRDAHTTVDLSAHGAPPPEQVIAHTNLYWKYHEAPGRKGGAVDTADVSF